MKNKINVRNCEILIGIFTFIKGIWLLNDQDYFFYPPNLVWLMDNQALDVIMALAGLFLVAFAFLTYKYSNEPTFVNMSKVALVVCGIGALILFLLQLTHGLFTPNYRMAHTAVGDLLLFILAYFTACDA